MPSYLSQYQNKNRPRRNREPNTSIFRKCGQSQSSSPPVVKDSVRSCFTDVVCFILSFTTLKELESLSQLSRESLSQCEEEWQLRFEDRYCCSKASNRMNMIAISQFRKCFRLRRYFEQNVVDQVSARVYLMNAQGDTIFFNIPTGQKLMCSKERALLYTRCERMFDLSLRINRSIQEISTLIGMISMEEARGILNEHIHLMASVAKLRTALLFESELFQVFPAPILLDSNALLRHTFAFQSDNEGLAFLKTSLVMMQIWVSIDGLIYRPLSPPSTLVHPVVENEKAFELSILKEQIGRKAREDSVPHVCRSTAPGSNNRLANANILPVQRSVTPSYRSVKLHELSGMTVTIDDNTLRYRFEKQSKQDSTEHLDQNAKLDTDTDKTSRSDSYDFCVNALISNTYLLYLFNPLDFRPLDWTYHATLEIGAEENLQKIQLPIQREGVLLNSTSFALRTFLSYGKIRDCSSENSIDYQEEGAPETVMGSRGAEKSEPLEIPIHRHEETIGFRLHAINRITKESREVAACRSPFVFSGSEVSKSDPSRASSSNDHQSSFASIKERVVERHHHFASDAMVSYSFAEPEHLLQYVEFAIGFEALLHLLGVTDFLKPS
uniref:Uncharacterized protein AlNc14C263G9840 n=1 Tax=Albugo laibachii Nc14 TaxID=890382 RepID=F0WU17_9STRA|nr:conserved hypothetical protein [Albugo laibachii Nc14]CCA24946.1 conserved hypothetical protein [Albugo laibachii Nc14]|eukprot:CCA24946.1 conserved hypothetical protein [Albugo laibachii Nc14]